MRPTDPISDKTNSASANPKALGDHRLRILRCSDFNYLICAYFRFVARFASASFVQSRSKGVSIIFAAGHIFQIFDDVVLLVAISVIDLQSFGAWTNEGSSDKYMNIAVICFWIAISIKVDLGIRNVMDRLYAFPSLTKSFYATHVGYFVKSFEPYNRLPNFNAILKFIHDRLSFKSVLWLEPLRVCNHLRGSFSLLRSAHAF